MVKKSFHQFHGFGDGDFLFSLEGDDEGVRVILFHLFQHFFGGGEIAFVASRVFPQTAFVVAIYIRKILETFVSEGDFFRQGHELHHETDTIGIHDRVRYCGRLITFFLIRLTINMIIIAVIMIYLGLGVIFFFLLVVVFVVRFLTLFLFNVGNAHFIACHLRIIGGKCAEDGVRHIIAVGVLTEIFLIIGIG